MAESREAAIKVNNVSKNFILPHLRKNTVKSIFTSLFDTKSKAKSEVQHALKDISFEIKKGEFFGIVGRNGSGKSTLLKMLAGIYQPTKGSIQVHGKLVPFIELGVGFNPELTGRENVYLNGALLGFDTKQIDAMYDSIVEFAELEKFMDQKLKNYSSGMQVRLAFSMAIRADADILLIDEVLAVGDADFQRKCFEYFKQLKHRKKTVVFVSHDMNAVREYCDRAILIDQSELVDEGPSDKIATQYLKLFNPTNNNKEKANKETRWGDKKITINKSAVTPVSLSDQDGVFKLVVDYKVNEKIESPIFGFRIKGPSGDPILGTNTFLLGLNTDHLTDNKAGSIVWEIPNLFSNGKFNIDLAISHSDGITQCDWWEDALSFAVYKTQPSPYVVNPLIGVEIFE